MGDLIRRGPGGSRQPVEPTPRINHNPWDPVDVTDPEEAEPLINRAVERAVEAGADWEGLTYVLSEMGLGGVVVYYGIDLIKQIYRDAVRRRDDRGHTFRPVKGAPGELTDADVVADLSDQFGGPTPDVPAVERMPGNARKRKKPDVPVEGWESKWSSGLKKFVDLIPPVGIGPVDAGINVAKTAFGVHSLYELYNNYYTMPDHVTGTSDHPAQGTMQMGSGPDFQRGKSSWSGNGNYVDTTGVRLFFSGDLHGSLSLGLNYLVVGHDQWNRKANQVCMCSSDLQCRVSMSPDVTNYSTQSGQLSVYIVYDRMGWTGLVDSKEIFGGRDYKGALLNNSYKADGLCMDDRFRFKVISKTVFDLRPNGSTGVEVTFPSFPLSNQRAYRRMGRLMSRYKDTTTPEPVVMGGLYLFFSGYNLGGVKLEWRHRLRFVPS